MVPSALTPDTISSKIVSTEAEAIITAIEKDWIPAAVGANWAVMAGLLEAQPPWREQWRDAAIAAHRERYGKVAGDHA